MIKRVDNNGLVHLVTNIRKPRKWRRFEYLLSSGTLWIDTGYKPNNNTRVVCDFQFTKENTYSRLFACSCGTAWNAIPNFQLSCESGVATGKIRLLIGNNTSFIVTQINGDFNRHTYDLSTTEFIYDGTQIGTYPSQTFQCTTTLPILVLRGQSYGPVASDFAIGKLYSFQIYDKDVLIRDFVPAEYNGQYGLWDLVEDRLYKNAGTGSFTVGPEIKNYDEIYEVRKTTSILPAGVELYDYIESSGTLWIDTDIIVNNSTTLIGSSVDFQVVLVEDGSTTIGGVVLTSGSDAYKNAQILVYSNAFYTNGSFTFSLNTVLNRTVATYNGNASGNPNASFLLFARHVVGWTPTELMLGSVKIFKATFYENNVLKRNMLPCTYLGEPGMWDTVENKFYRNQGTGLFTLGAKVLLKLYESITTSGTQWINTNYYPNVNTKLILKRSNHSSNSMNDGEIDGYLGLDGAFYVSGTLFAFDRFKTIPSMRNVNPYVVQLSSDGLFINGSFIDKQTDYRNNWVSPREFYLMAINRGDSITPSYNTIYYCKLYDNNQLVRDFIPVSYNGTPGLWDKVEWKFYTNAGSGSFTLGPEKASGTYPIWTPIEYLESTGTQYIDTGIVPNDYNGLIFTIDYLITQYLFGSGNRFGCYSYINGDNSSFFMILFMNTNYVRVNLSHGGMDNDMYADMTQRHTIIINSINGTGTVDNSTYSVNNGGTISNTYPICLFASNGNGSVNNFSTGRLYKSSISSADNVLRDFIPVRIGTTGYMYDKVSGQLFGNAGTGNFILGPDL